MKVLHVIDSAGLYGAEIMLLNLAAEQAQQGIEPVIASIGDPNVPEKPLEAEATRRGLRVEKFRMRPGPNIMGGLQILRYAWQENVDICHSHGYKGNILLGMLPRAIRKIPVVATLHGYTSTGKMNRMCVYEWIDLLSLNFIECVVLVNAAMRTKVNHHNLHVVNNGLPYPDDSHSNSFENESPPLDGKIVDFCKGGFTIGAIGRLSKEKGFDFLLEAMKIVLSACPDVRLVIIGEGGQRSFLEAKAIKLRIDDIILITGYRDRASRYLQYFDALALSSLTEGLPIVILEAMRAGVPIVATMVGGVPEVLENGEAGILVRSSDPAALAEGIIKLFEEPGLRLRLTEKAKSIVRVKYSSNRMAEEYKKIYCGLLTNCQGTTSE